MLKIRRIITAAAAALTVLLLSVVSFAAEFRVDDKAGLFTLSQKKTAQTEVGDLTALTGWKIIVLTTDNVDDAKSEKEILQFANDYYNRMYDEGTDGLVLLIYTKNNNYYINTNGACTDFFAGTRLKETFDYMRANINSKNYSGAVSDFCAYTTTMFGEGAPVDENPPGPFRIWNDVLAFALDKPIAVIAALAVIVAGACYVYIKIEKKYKLEEELTASEYFIASSVNITLSTETFIKEYSRPSNSRGRLPLPTVLVSDEDKRKERLASLYDSFGDKKR